MKGFGKFFPLLLLFSYHYIFFAFFLPLPFMFCTSSFSSYSPNSSFSSLSLRDVPGDFEFFSSIFFSYRIFFISDYRIASISKISSYLRFSNNSFLNKLIYYLFISFYISSYFLVCNFNFWFSFLNRAISASSS